MGGSALSSEIADAPSGENSRGKLTAKYIAARLGCTPSHPQHTTKHTEPRESEFAILRMKVWRARLKLTCPLHSQLHSHTASSHHVVASATQIRCSKSGSRGCSKWRGYNHCTTTGAPRHTPAEPSLHGDERKQLHQHSVSLSFNVFY